MKEELYIYTKDGVRKSVDLNTPSGITLKWVSNLFNSLDKVNCSYSYTFKIPITRHNREVFDMAEDIRHNSTMLGRKVKAEFIQNGIPLFDNANLYVSKSTADSYSCVFTWGVLEGLQKLKDDGCSLNELRTALIEAGETDDELVKGEGYIDWYGGDKSYTEYSNNSKFFNAHYSAGIKSKNYNDFNPNFEEQENVPDNDNLGSGTLINDLSPKAVMPVKYIIDKINKAFSTKINICKNIVGSNLKQDRAYNWLFEGSNLFDYGVLPLTGNKLTEKQQNIFSRDLKMDFVRGSNSGYGILSANGTIMGTDYILIFDTSNVPDSKTYNGAADMPIYYIYARLYDENGKMMNWNLPKTWELLADLQLGWKYPSYISEPSTYDPKKHVCIGINSNYAVKLTGSFRVRTKEQLISGKEDETMVKLNVYGLRMTGDVDSDGQVIERVDVTSIKPISVTPTRDGEYIYDFNMNDDEGFNSQSLENTENNGINFFWFGFSKPITSFEQYTDFKVVAQINEEKKRSHLIDTYTNLPDIDCLTFIKTLFYMEGSFPKIMSDGTIRSIRYDEIKENVKNGNAYDWSKKIIGGNSEEITYQASDFKQHNYYMTKWDDLDRTEEELKDEEDVYENGIGDITISDNSLDKENTVQQIPFYPPYILCRKHPNLPTGYTIKIWNIDNSDQEISWNGKYLQRKELQTITEAQPAYGYVHRIPFMEDNSSKIISWEKLPSIDSLYGNEMRMSVLNPFKDVLMNPSYRYFQQIVEKPYTVTENLLLDELDLMSIDYTKPVYIEKYNSYFAIISIQRDSKGVCKCELIKLPAYKAPVKVTLSFTSQLAKFLHFKCSSTSSEDKTISIGFIIENPNEGQYVRHSKINLSSGEFQLFNPTSNTNWVIKDIWLDHYEKGDYNDYEFEIQ